jgi:ubiquinone/menaquinone biosynthesis C-methylase UbiE/uncharacterized protein YbaR (Trm112 family)
METHQKSAFRDGVTDILRCPITHRPLRQLAPHELDDINRLILTGQILHPDGSAVRECLHAGLVSATGRFVYRIDNGIFVLLPALAIVPRTSQDDPRRVNLGRATLCSDKRAVQQFYDEVGWQHAGNGDFVDAEKWEDLRRVASDYVRRCHLRVNEHLQPRGEYLLDVASGPVQYAEYLTYSNGYSARICVDISIAALEAARRKLGTAGIYILGDITDLPLAAGSVQGVVSLHTIYHVPAAQQARAFREIHRVLAAGHNAVVVYCWPSFAIKLAKLPASGVRRLGRIAAKFKPGANGRSAETSASNPEQSPPARLYYHAYPYCWFARQRWGFSWKIWPWRSVTVPLMRAYFHRWLLGRTLLAALFRLEQALPRLFGRFGAYPMIVIHKGGANDHA